MQWTLYLYNEMSPISHSHTSHLPHRHTRVYSQRSELFGYIHSMKLVALMVMVMRRGYVYSLTVQITILVEDGMVMLILSSTEVWEKLPIPVTESLSISITNNDDAHIYKLRAGWHNIVERYSSLHAGSGSHTSSQSQWPSLNKFSSSLIVPKARSQFLFTLLSIIYDMS